MIACFSALTRPNRTPALQITHPTTVNWYQVSVNVKFNLGRGKCVGYWYWCDFSVYDNYLSKQLFRLRRKNWFAGDKWLLALVLHLIAPSSCLPFFDFWCRLKQMFRKASFQKGSIDMLDGVVLHKRKKPLNVLALKQKKASTRTLQKCFRTANSKCKSPQK